jgi:hypothetical protein
VLLQKIPGSIWNSLLNVTNGEKRSPWPGRTPFCELSNHWRGEATNYGQVTSRGYQIRFNAEAFSFLPEEVARFVIAHELAHVFQKAEGKRPGGANEVENEADADSIAERWEFRGYAFRTFNGLVARQGFKRACQLMGT